MNSYFRYTKNSNVNNFYPLYSNYVNSYKNQINSSNSEEQRNQNKNGTKIYDNYTINFRKININQINYDPKNKNASLQEEILSPNVEDSRPSIPIPLYYDDTRYRNFYNFNHNYNTNNNITKNQNNNNSLYNATNNHNKEKKGIFEISVHKNINYNKKMLILDLDETLVHSCFKPAENNNNIAKPDILLKIKFHSKYHDVFVYKRPFVDEFLEKMNKYYNLIIFTASVQEYADPLLDQLDKNRFIKLRYYRNSCLLDKKGKFIKNLSTIYNDLKNVILLDNNPISYSYNKSNGLPIITWQFDKKDRELLKLIPILEFLSEVNDIRNYLPRFIEYDMVNFSKFNILIDEINKEREHNNHIKKRPKSSKHISPSNKENPKNQNQYNKQNKEEKIINIKENKNQDRNRHHSLNKEKKKYNTINNTSSKMDKENTNQNKSLILKKKLLVNNDNIQMVKNNIVNNQRIKAKHKKRKINNLFNKDNTNKKIKEIKEIKENMNYSNEFNHNSDYMLKENKNNQLIQNKFIIVNDKEQNIKNDNINDNQNKNPNNNINNHILFMKNNPFIMKTEKKPENKSYSLFSELKTDDDKNKKIQINIINNIQQINLFKNEFDIKNNNNIKKIDIINYYKNNSEKKSEKMKPSYFLKDNDNKIINEKNTRNQLYINRNDKNKNLNINNNINYINNSQNYYYNSTQNLFPQSKNKINNYVDNNDKIRNSIQNKTKNEYNNNNYIRNNILNSNNLNKDNTRYSMYNNYISNNNLYKDKNNQNNSQINKIHHTLLNDNFRRKPNYDDNNYLSRPINHIVNSNFNNFYYNNNNYRYENQINNIHPYYYSNIYNNNYIDYRYDLNNNYHYKGNQRVYY